MAHVSPAEIQEWIRNTRLAVTSVDATKDESFFRIASSKLTNRYNVTVWVDASTTPSLIRTIIGMLYAANEINAGNAESTNEINAYGVHLESSAMALLGGLADGSIDLVDIAVTDLGVTYTDPVFWPTRMATAIAKSDGIDADGAAQQAFSMGQIF